MAHQKFPRIIGQRFGKLVVQSFDITPSKVFARCLCDCGRTSRPLWYHLVHGRVKSCGCAMGSYPRKLSPTTQKILNLVEAHPEYSLVRIASECGCTKQNVHSALKGNGISSNYRIRLLENEVAILRQLLQMSVIADDPEVKAVLGEIPDV